MKKSIYYFIILFLAIVSINEASSKNITDSIKNSFAKFIPSEKLYIHTDKPNYFVGDTVWFAGYLQNAADLSGGISNFIYIDIIDSRDSIILHKKIKRVNGSLNGHMELGWSIPEGNYCIRAYSNWMRNFPKENYFYKNFKVSKLFEKNLSFWADVDKIDSTKFSLKLGVIGEPLIKKLSNKPLDFIIRNLTTGKRSRIKDEMTNSHAYVDIETKGISAGDIVLVDIKGEIEEGKFSSSVRVRIPEKDFDIQFLPEGGDFINGGLRKIAYKALSSNGSAVDVKGFILDEQGDTISHFKSQRSGMGVVELFARPNKSYTAHVTTPDSLFKRVNLPEIKSDGVAISLYYNKDKVSYIIEKVGAFAQEKLYAVVHNRGQLQYIQPITTPVVRHSFSYKDLAVGKAGIVHILIVNSKSEPVAERLLFIDPSYYNQDNTLKIKSNKATYAKRERVSLSIESSEHINGMFSISVTDSKLVKADSTADNIVSNLLLTSDLNGIIENPSSYLGSRDIDLLMLTNGWRKFNVENILKSLEQHAPRYIEVGQIISGKVVSRNKRAPKSDILCQITESNFARLHPLSSDLQFMFDGFDIAGEQEVILKVLHPKRSNLGADIKIVDNFKRATAWTKFQLETAPSKPQYSAYEKNAEHNILNTSGLEYAYAIDEVFIKGRRRKSRSVELDEHEPMRLSKESMYASEFNDYIPYISSGSTLQQIIERQMRASQKWRVGTYIVDNDIYETNNISIDDDPFGDDSFVNQTYDLSMLPFIQGSDIVAIELTTFPEHAIVVETLYGSGGRRSVYIPDFLKFTFEGYDKCEKKFYSPKYTSDQKVDEFQTLDYRSTLYWNPTIEIINGRLKYPIVFYTSDNVDTQLNVIIEGLETKNNAPINSQQMIEVK